MEIEHGDLLPILPRMSAFSPQNGGLAALFALVGWACCPALFATPPVSSTPRPAVARIIVPEEGATAYGSGTLIDVRDQYGLVVTNWHVVRDARGLVEVVFPNGFRSHARPVKLDADWDLAALVIWRPPIQPVPIADRAPEPGDTLTICGYGQGTYREATGHCTQYLAPGIEFPREMVELNVEARQGDSGGPIFNDRGALAGVLFGASRGTTLGSFGGRVESFLTSLAPDIGQPDMPIAATDAPPVPRTFETPVDSVGRDIQDRHDSPPVLSAVETLPEDSATETPLEESEQPLVAEHVDVKAEPSPSASFPDDADAIEFSQPAVAAPVAALSAVPTTDQAVTWRDVAGETWFQQLKTLLACVGLIVIVLWMLRLAV